MALEKDKLQPINPGSLETAHVLNNLVDLIASGIMEKGREVLQRDAFKALRRL